MNVTPEAFISWSSLALSVAALLVSWFEVRRNNIVIVKIRELKSTYTGGGKENKGESYYHLTIDLRNVGIALHDVSAKISWSGLDWEDPACSVKLDRTNDQSGELARGMSVRFEAKSYHFRRTHGPSLWSKLKDPVRQKLKLKLFSQGYPATTLKLGSRLDRLRWRWNGVASKINRWFYSERYIHGMTVVRAREPLPMLKARGLQVMFFAEGTTKQQASAAEQDRKS